MKVLTIDIGTGTQDIYLYDSRLDLENGFKLVAPSPTMLVHQKLKKATRRRQAVLLSGVMMGGGPSAWAAEAHAAAGLAIYATPEAAKTLNDDLQAVQDLGITLVSEDEATGLPASVERIHMADIDLTALHRAFEQLGITLDGLAAIAVAVFDHGDSPPGYSDRQFRFDYLDERIRQQNRLSAFAYSADQAPASMTRLQAVIHAARQSSSLDFAAPLVVMDTAPAAVLGATLDWRVAERERVMIVNVGNFHTLAFRLGPAGIEGLFEHHTGLVDRARLENLLTALADGSLQHADVFGDHGHGALLYDSRPLPLSTEQDFGVVVAGPRRSMLKDSRLKPYFAAPFGDMMITGCFGLLTAVADILPELAEPIRASLHGRGGSGAAPWDI
jgi:uncharacterized protein (DUF1786 family)